MWCRAVWKEGKKEVEDVVPFIWIQENVVRWPPGLNSEKQLKAMARPASSWRSFGLVKVKCKYASKEECESYDLTSALESSIEEDEDEMGKRKQKKKKFTDYLTEISSTDLITDQTCSKGSDSASNGSSSSQTDDYDIPPPPKKAAVLQSLTPIPRDSQIDRPGRSQTDDYNIPLPPKETAVTGGSTPKHRNSQTDSQGQSATRRTESRQGRSTSRLRDNSAIRQDKSRDRQSDRSASGLRDQTDRRNRSRSRQRDDRYRSASSLRESPTYRRQDRSRSGLRDRRGDRSGRQDRSRSRLRDRRRDRSGSSFRYSETYRRTDRSLSRLTDRSRSRQRDSRRDHCNSGQRHFRRDRSASRSSLDGITLYCRQNRPTSQPKDKRRDQYTLQQRDRRQDSMTSTMRDGRQDCLTTPRDRRQECLTSTPRDRRQDRSTSRLRDRQTNRHSGSRSRSNSVSLLRPPETRTLENIPSSSKTGRVSDGFPMSESKFQRKVVHLLLELRTALNDLSGRPTAHPNSAPLSDCLSRRADSVEEFNKMNDTLKNTPDRIAMIEQLRMIGGNDYKDNVQKILRRVMSNELMSKFNMKGNRGKMRFDTTGLCQVIVESAQKTFTSTEHSIHQIIGAYLKYAPDRCGGGGRKKRDGAQENRT